MLLRAHDPLCEAPYPVHSVEVGGDFLTLWLRGEAGCDWARALGLPDYHQRERFHGDASDQGWLPQVYPGKEAHGWSAHRHVVLGHAPTATVLERFRDGLSPELYQAALALLPGDEPPETPRGRSKRRGG